MKKEIILFLESYLGFRYNEFLIDDILSRETDSVFNFKIVSTQNKWNIHVMSLSWMKDLEQSWNKGGFRKIFNTPLKFGLNFNNFGNSIILKTKNFDVKTRHNCLKDSYYTTILTEIKKSKKTGRIIAFDKQRGEWIDLFDMLSPIPETNNRRFRFLPFDKDFTNGNPENVCPVPFGYNIKQLKDQTFCSDKFDTYPEIQYQLETLDACSAYTMMISQNDKVWLNHNIVCTVMDNFLAYFLTDNLEKKVPHKSHFFILNAYARKFGIFPTLDRLILTYWKFQLLIHSSYFFLLNCTTKQDVQNIPFRLKL